MHVHAVIHNIGQNREEALHSFAAKIYGEAGDCQHNVKCLKCSINVDLTDCVL